MEIHKKKNRHNREEQHHEKERNTPKIAFAHTVFLF